MKVHEVVYHTTLDVILDLVDDDVLADIDKLDIGKVGFVGVDRLVNPLVVADAVAEILSSLFGILANVVGRRCLHFENVAHDEILVVTLRLYK